MNEARKPPVRDALSRTRRVLFWVRRGTLLYALLGVAYLGWRFEVQTIPEDGVSPLSMYRPGAHLLVDLHRTEASEGEAVLFRDGEERLLLGRVARAPSEETRTGLWILADSPDLPDSRTLGPIAAERVVGRVVMALPGFE